jgi:glycosyltransferase involved in cell wall biosynthesis
VRRITGWDLVILLPAVWRDEFGNTLRPLALPGFDVELVTVPVCLNRNIILHVYRFDFGRFLSRGEFDLIYVHNEPYAAATAQVCWANLRSTKLPFGFYSAQNISKRYPVPFRWTEQMVYRSSSFAFPVTDTVQDVLITRGFEGETTVCPLWVDPMRYACASDKSPEPLNSLRDEVLIGYVGRIVEQKGLRTLAEAVSRLPRTGWRLVLIGDGPFAAHLDRLCETLNINDRVVRLGYVPHEEMPRFLAALDILVLPSETQSNWREQFGRVIVEALACAVPVIGSDSGEIPTLVSRSGGGLTFPERNAEALADAMRKMIEDRELRNECARRGRAWVLQQASLGAVAEKMASTMDRMVRFDSQL